MIFVVGAPLSCGKIKMMLKMNGVKVDERPKIGGFVVDWYNKEIDEEKLLERIIKTRGEVGIEVNEDLALAVGMIKKAFPQARIVFVVRDGEDSVSEYKEKNFYRGEKRIFSGIKSTQFFKQCLLWNAVNDYMLEWYDEKKDLIVKVEQKEFKALEAMLKVSLKKMPMEHVKKPKRFDKGEKKMFWNVCWNMMDRLGYKKMSVEEVYV